MKLQLTLEIKNTILVLSFFPWYKPTRYTGRRTITGWQAGPLGYARWL
jgi:hypothetical protein